MFWNIFYELCSETGKKPNQTAKELGISSGALTKWKNGALPGSQSLTKIADHFGVTTDYLLGKSAERKKPASDSNELYIYMEELRNNPEMRIMFDLCHGASKEDLQKAVELIRGYMGK